MALPPDGVARGPRAGESACPTLEHTVSSDLLAAAAEEVLETMFFTSPLGPGEPSSDPGLAAVVVFRGSPSGACGVWMSPPAAREIAASFLGREDTELEPAQVEQVLCEFANMICGSVVSRLESSARIELDPPRPAGAEEFPSAMGAGAAVRWFQLESGTLGLALRVQENA